ncbi:hypothetical protein CLF_110332, partial [Clonorchis sinensis]
TYGVPRFQINLKDNYEEWICFVSRTSDVVLNDYSYTGMVPDATPPVNLLSAYELDLYERHLFPHSAITGVKSSFDAYQTYIKLNDQPKSGLRRKNLRQYLNLGSRRSAKVHKRTSNQDDTEQLRKQNQKVSAVQFSPVQTSDPVISVYRLFIRPAILEMKEGGIAARLRYILQLHKRITGYYRLIIEVRLSPEFPPIFVGGLNLMNLLKNGESVQTAESSVEAKNIRSNSFVGNEFIGTAAHFQNDRKKVLNRKRRPLTYECVLMKLSCTGQISFSFGVDDLPDGLCRQVYRFTSPQTYRLRRGYSVHQFPDVTAPNEVAEEPPEPNRQNCVVKMLIRIGKRLKEARDPQHHIVKIGSLRRDRLQLMTVNTRKFLHVPALQVEQQYDRAYRLQLDVSAYLASYNMALVLVFSERIGHDFWSTVDEISLGAYKMKLSRECLSCHYVAEMTLKKHQNYCPKRSGSEENNREETDSNYLLAARLTIPEHPRISVKSSSDVDLSITDSGLGTIVKTAGAQGQKTSSCFKRPRGWIRNRVVPLENIIVHPSNKQQECSDPKAAFSVNPTILSITELLFISDGTCLQYTNHNLNLGIVNSSH